MLLLLNYKHNKMKQEAERKKQQEEAVIRRRKRRAKEELATNNDQVKEDTEGKEDRDPIMRKQKKKKGSDVRKKKARTSGTGNGKKRRFAIPREKLWEAYVIVFIGFGIPAAYGLFNVCSALYNKAMGPIEKATSMQTPMTPAPPLQSYRLSEYIYDPGLRVDSVPSARLVSVDRRSRLSLEDYYNLYDAKWPVVISDCVPNWEAANKWNEEFFIKHYGSERVTMAAVSGRLDNAQQLALPLNMFISHLNDSSPTSWTYMQDELFLPKRPELLGQIGTCGPLKEDFFTLFPKEARPWWAFLLWGTKYSRSQLHIDPYNWTGTNAVLKGRKRWKLYLPGQDHLLYPRNQYIGKYPLRSYKYNSFADAFDPMVEDRYPLLSKAKYIEFVQQPGELLIIPTGWFHQAYNEEPTMAIAGQLMNRGNYRTVLEELLKADNLPRSGYPSYFEKLGPTEQVELCLSRLKLEALAEAAATTQDVLNQMDQESLQYLERGGEL